MWNYMFTINDENSAYCDQEIFVQESSLKKAWGILKQLGFNLDKVVYCEKLNDDEAEKLGFDTF